MAAASGLNRQPGAAAPSFLPCKEGDTLWPRQELLSEILLVEDNPGRRSADRRGAERGKEQQLLPVVRDGAEAIDYLHAAAPMRAAPRPDLILLDLNLPKKDGREVLAEIKEDADLKRIPVVVLTTSKAEKDIVRRTTCMPTASSTKPVDLEAFIGVVRSIEDFWLTIVALPKRLKRIAFCGTPATKTAQGSGGPKPMTGGNARASAMESAGRCTGVLLIEDNPGDALLIREMMARARSDGTLLPMRRVWTRGWRI